MHTRGATISHSRGWAQRWNGVLWRSSGPRSTRQKVRQQQSLAHIRLSCLCATISVSSASFRRLLPPYIPTAIRPFATCIMYRFTSAAASRHLNNLLHRARYGSREDGSVFVDQGCSQRVRFPDQAAVPPRFQRARHCSAWSYSSFPQWVLGDHPR
jgi:hypothetical protein